MGSLERRKLVDMLLERDCWDYYLYMRDGTMEPHFPGSKYCEAAITKVWPEIRKWHLEHKSKGEAESFHKELVARLKLHLIRNKENVILGFGLVILGVLAALGAIGMPINAYMSGHGVFMVILSVIGGMMAGLAVGCLVMLPIICLYWGYYYRKLAKILATIIATEQMCEATPIDLDAIIEQVS